MADWFKLYENDLDDERLQWAMSEQQQTAIVYVTILSRCCRDKSGTLPWNGQDFELFALAQKAHIPPPIANQSLGLLEKIQFIKIENGELKVLKWNDRQSEYCRKKESGVGTVSGHTPDNIRRVSPERRGEEIREEDIQRVNLPTSTDSVVDPQKSPSAPISQKREAFKKPTIEEVKLAGAKSGLPESESEKMFHYYESIGWKVGKNPMKSLNSAVAGWAVRWRENGGNLNGAHKSLMDKQIDATHNYVQRLIGEGM